MAKEFRLPDLGEGLTEAEIVRVLVAEGDEIKEDQAVLLVETAFLQLEAPVRRVTAYDIVYPGFARERGWLPGPDRVLRAIRETLAF